MLARFVFGPLDDTERELDDCRVGYPITHVTESLHDQDFVRWVHHYQYYGHHEDNVYYRYSHSTIDCMCKISKMDADSLRELRHQITTQLGIMHMLFRTDNPNGEED